jgi:hypothetical protein
MANVENIPSIESMAMEIAKGIFQNDKLLDDCYEMAEQSARDGEKRSVTQYVGILAVDTAYWIQKYAQAKKEVTK